jgi:polysaccharide biosynthesis/export protein
MKINSLKSIVSFLVLLTLSFSCVSKKEVVYYNNAEDALKNAKALSYEIKIHPDDLLMINVGAEDPEIAAPFNVTVFTTPSQSATASYASNDSSRYYLVDHEGYINFPTLGRIKIGGLSSSQAIEMLQKKIALYIKNPFVNLRLMNFKFTIQGEVAAPGVYKVDSERLTLIEAISMAHDLTLYGKRENILIIREINGVKTFNRIDITKADFINSPFYYITQNDVIYVEPIKTKINDRGIGATTGVLFSLVSVILSVATFIKLQ